MLHQHLADNHYNKTETDDLIDAINAFHYMGSFDATQDTLPEPTEDNAGNYYLCTVGGTYDTVDLAIGDMLVLYYIAADNKGWNKLDNSNLTGALMILNNLSDLNDLPTARTNLEVAKKGSTWNNSKIVSTNGSGELSTVATSTTTLSYLDIESGLTALLAAKQNNSGLTASKVLQTSGAGIIEPSTISTTTLGYLDATSSVQTQIDSKQASSGVVDTQHQKHFKHQVQE